MSSSVGPSVGREKFSGPSSTISRTPFALARAKASSISRTCSCESSIVHSYDRCAISGPRHAPSNVSSALADGSANAEARLSRRLRAKRDRVGGLAATNDDELLVVVVVVVRAHERISHATRIPQSRGGEARSVDGTARDATSHFDER